MTDVLTGDDFNTWVAQTKAAGQTLDAATLAQLELPAVRPDPITYSRVDGNPFGAILAKFGMITQMEAMP